MKNEDNIIPAKGKILVKPKSFQPEHSNSFYRESHDGSLTLSHGKLSLAEEIKILIRKLWD